MFDLIGSAIGWHHCRTFFFKWFSDCLKLIITNSCHSPTRIFPPPGFLTSELVHWFRTGSGLNLISNAQCITNTYADVFRSFRLNEIYYT